MAQLGHASNSQALLQSMLQKLQLQQEQRSDQGRLTTSEDVSSRISQDVLVVGGGVAGEILTGGTLDDNPQQTLRSRWAGFRKGSTKSLELSKGNTGQKDSLTFSDIEDVPKWDRKQLRFSVVADIISERKNGLIDEAQGHLKPPQSTQSNTSSPLGGTPTTDSPGFPGEPLTPSPGCVGAQVMTASEHARRDSVTTVDTDNVSLTDSLTRNGQAVDVAVGRGNVRKNKRKWNETKTKSITQKIKDKWSNRHPTAEKQNIKVEEKHTTDEQVPSTASIIQENGLLPSPAGEVQSEGTLGAQGYDSISLYGFDMGFETTLMEDIFTGPEWTRFLASNAADPQAMSTTDTDGPSTYHIAEEKPCKTVQAQTAAEVLSFEAMLTDSDIASGMGGEMTDVAQTVCDEIREEDGTQLSSSVDVSSVQLEEIKSETDNQNTDTNPDPNESQTTTESLEQSNMQDTCQNQSDDVSETASESNMDDDDDDKDQNQTDSDLSQANTNDTDPHPTEITASTPEQPATVGEINPYEEVMMATPDTLHQGATADMLNPYLEIDTGGGDSSETEDDGPYLSSQTGDAGSSSVGEVEENSPQLLPLTDLSYVKAEEEDESISAHERRRRLNSEERETFIDEEDDDDSIPSDSLSWRKVPLSPPPFPPPLPPQRSVSVDSMESSSSYLEIVPKKRRLDSAPRRVRFADEVVMLPQYIQPEVEDWPERDGGDEEEEEDEEEDEEMEEEDPGDMEDTEAEMMTVLPQQEMRSADEAAENPRETQQASLYSWILGITKKTKRKSSNVEH